MARGRAISLIHFSVIPAKPVYEGGARPKTGPSVRVKKTSGRSKASRSFIARKRNTGELAVLRRQGQARRPIREMWGPGTAVMLEQKGLSKTILKKAQHRLEKNVERRVNLTLAPGGAAMTGLLLALKAFFEEKLAAWQNTDPSGDLSAVHVFIGAAPQRSGSDAEQYPLVLVRPREGEDHQDGKQNRAEAVVEIICGVHVETSTGTPEEGTVGLSLMMDRIRRELMKGRADRREVQPPEALGVAGGRGRRESGPSSIFGQSDHPVEHAGNRPDPFSGKGG